jgi:RHS repeat-associated protein
VTQIANGLSTTTFTYDNNGNVTQKTVDGTTTTYVYDYANRLTALGVLGATTTYAYDAFGQRVLQTGTTTTYLYPFKWYSVASSTGTGAKYATTTDYVFNGDSLVATVDQQTASGNATGTAKTRYVHPDHLGSTNVVTDENDNVVQTLDYYPYGSTRISSATSTNERRKFIGQFADDSTLNDLQARYYDAGRGQFLSEDPIFLTLGSPQLQQASGISVNVLYDHQSTNSVLATSVSNGFGAGTLLGSQTASVWAEYLHDPQQQNVYGYSRDNPIRYFDPTGQFGIFANVNAGGDAGLGEGFSGSAESGVGFTAGNSLSTPVDFGSYGSTGYLVGGPYGGATMQGVSSGINNNTVLGLSGGAGFGVMLTNATRISQLDGVVQTHNLTLGIGSVSWSVSADGIWTISVSIGAKPLLSYSTYPTGTVTNTTFTSTPNNSASTGSGSGGSGSNGSSGSSGSGSSGWGSTHTACGALCL